MKNIQLEGMLLKKIFFVCVLEKYYKSMNKQEVVSELVE